MPTMLTETNGKLQMVSGDRKDIIKIGNLLKKALESNGSYLLGIRISDSSYAIIATRSFQSITGQAFSIRLKFDEKQQLIEACANGEVSTGKPAYGELLRVMNAYAAVKQFGNSVVASHIS